MDAILEGLTEAQRQAVTAGSKRLRILAGAGSGKTRVLTRRIAHGANSYSIDPEHTLALTFTRKAAGELRSRLRTLGLRDSVTAGTFHATALAQLRTRWNDQGIRPPELADRRGRILARVLPRSLSPVERAGVLAEVDWATARRINATNYPAESERAGRRPPFPPAQIAQYMRDFADLKQQRRMVDFDDLLELCIRDMADPAQAKVQHWRFRHLFVDEFQDVNPLQFDLLRAWLGPEATLCVVGDPNQAIYSWNGADAGYLERFPQFFPGAHTVELADNFRSTPQILDAAARILGGRGRLHAHRRDGQRPVVERCDDDAAEAAAVARRIRDRHVPGGRWARQAVLVRTNAQTATIAEALRQAKVPVSIREGASLLDDPRVASRLHELAETSVPIATVLADLRLDAREAADDTTREVLESLSVLADDHRVMHPDATSTQFVTWVRSALAADGRPGETDAVEVLTFHAAKGLEWPVVHIAGVEEGLVPIARALTPDAREEELRLFYVAVTRAEEELYCTWAARRRFGERWSDRRPSPLLERMQAATEAPASLPDRARRNVDRVRQLRASLGVTDPDAPAAPDLREMLRDWRTSAARSSGVPAYVVFGDRTLDALVRDRPGTAEDLRAIPGLGPVKVARYGDELLAMIGAATATG